MRFSPYPLMPLPGYRFTLLLVIVVLLCTTPGVLAQTDTIPDPPPTRTISEEDLYLRIESLLEDREEEIDITELLEELEVLMMHPLNLNTASAEQLRRIIFLSDIQINNLILHRSQYGNLISLFELQSIQGFDLEIIRLIEPYVSVQETVARRQISFNDILERGNSVYFLRYQQYLEEQKGFSPISQEELQANPNARYLGSPFRLYNRYRFTYYNNISLGITAEKDPGEEFFKGSQTRGFDFYSAHFYLRDIGRVKSLALGDYQVQFGQGLTLWSGLAFGKSAESINIKKNGLGLRPYTSVDENLFMRGAGTTLQLGKFEITGFYSRKFRDANVLLRDTISQEALEVTSLQNTGLHRTPRELENRNAVSEQFMGSNITYRRSHFHVGATAYYMELDAALNRNLSYYNQFDLNLRTNWAAGIDYNYLFRNFNFFGETARSQSGGYALLNGVMMSLDPRLSLSVLHRKFSPDYQSLLSTAFAENSRVSNENGLYLGLSARLSRQLTLYAYADHFSFPWMKYRTYAPSRGYDYMTQINYRPSRGTEFYARYRIKNKPINSSDPSPVRYLEDAMRENIRLHASYPVSPSFTLKNRVELVWYQQGNKKQQGFLIYQDIQYRNFKSPWVLTMRYAIFDTDGYDSRLYAYENDVLYASSFPFYADKGHRMYLLARYRVSRKIDLQGRIAQTVYTNRNSIGSGLDEIQGNTRTELKVQMRIRF